MGDPQIDAMKGDISEIKEILREVSEALRTLAKLEVKHDNVKEAVERAHGRLNSHGQILDMLVPEVKTTRLIANASIWTVGVAVVAFIGAAVTGVLG